MLPKNHFLGRLGVPGVLMTVLLFSLVLSACGDDTATVPPATSVPTTKAAIVVAPTTSAPTTVATTSAPTTVATTVAPTTVAPTTSAPTTVATTIADTTAPATTSAPTTTQAATDSGAGTSTAAVGKELQGQLLALNLKPGDIDSKVASVENFDDLKYNSQSASPGGVFVAVLVDVANIGKDPASLTLGTFKLTDAKGRSFEYAKGDAVFILEEQDSKKYLHGGTVQPGQTARYTFVFDVPQNATGLKIVPTYDGDKAARQPSEASFKPVAAGNGQDSGAGQELVNQLIAADDSSANLDIQVTGVERKADVTNGKTVKAKGVFLILQMQMANTGKRTSSYGYHYVAIQDSNGRKYTTNNSTDAGDLLERIDPAKYHSINSVLPGFTEVGTVVFDIPVDAAKLTLVSNDGTTNRKPDPESFKKSGGTGPDSGAGSELVGRTLTKDQVDYVVTKVYRLKTLTTKGRTLAKTDGIFLVMVYEANNKSGKKISAISPATLIDNQARRYPAFASAYILDDVPEVTTVDQIEDGQKGVRYSLYEVPKDSSGFTLETR